MFVCVAEVVSVVVCRAFYVLLCWILFCELVGPAIYSCQLQFRNCWLLYRTILFILYGSLLYNIYTRMM